MSSRIDCPDCAGSGKCPGCFDVPGMEHDAKTCAACIREAEILDRDGLDSLAETICMHCDGYNVCGMCGGTGHVYD